jgi:hypothetical protein
MCPVMWPVCTWLIMEDSFSITCYSSPLPLQPVLVSWVWTGSCKNKFFVPTHAALLCLDIGRGGGVERLQEPLLSSLAKSHMEIIYQGQVGTIFLHNGPGGWGSRSLLFLANAILNLRRPAHTACTRLYNPGPQPFGGS